MEGASIRMERAQRRLGGPGVLGYLLLALLTAIALAIYFVAAKGLSERGTWFVIGEASGVAAAVLLPLAVILASRLRPLEWLFGDMTRVYVSHAVVGMSMFALVSVHPLLYVVGTLHVGAGVDAAAHVIVPFHLVVLDWISYLTIAAALIFTLYVRLPFVTWRTIHVLLGAALMLTGYSILIDNHAFDTFQIPALRAFLFVLYGLATAAFIWVALIARFLDPKREYEITRVVRHPEVDAMEIRARPVGKPIDFTAGQFAGVDLLDDRLQIRRDFEAHPYSITTAPGDDEIGLVIQATGDHTHRIQEIAEADGARALVHTPHGHLSIDRPRRKRQLWVGGGIGITPFLSMAADLAANAERYPDHRVTLVVGVDHPEQAFFLEHLRELAASTPALEVHLWNREQRDLPTAEGLAKLLDGDVTEHAVMLCGPEAMISALEEQFRALGVPRGQIRWQRGIGPPDRWRSAAPALRRLRLVATTTFGLFTVLVIASTVGRAIS